MYHDIKLEVTGGVAQSSRPQTSGLRPVVVGDAYKVRAIGDADPPAHHGPLRFVAARVVLVGSTV